MQEVEVEIRRIVVPGHTSLQNLTSTEKARSGGRKNKIGGSWSRPARAKSKPLSPK
jgi:hypothetical protein